MTQDIGTRMKSYEQNRRVADGAIIVRIDGKAFHTWTKEINAERPFDMAVISSMADATFQVSRQMQGFSLAYTQSDESTFLLTNLGEKEQSWFAGKLDKIVSVTASMFTYYFNYAYNYWCLSRGYPKVPAFFDARAHNIPIEDAANNFVWRQQDWMRNSVNMLAQAHFSHKELQGKSTLDVKQMLLDIDVNWDDLSEWNKYGTFFTKDIELPQSIKADYNKINELAGISVT